MKEKIFISYNHKDGLIIDNVLQKLELEFGRNNIFYDKWSIQPGDSIIGKMNDGLSDFSVFFFFVSKNSLQSKMVSLEWQTALNRAINKDLKFIAVKIDDCCIPTIISNLQYIDFYGEGFDDTVTKMKSVIKSENTYRPMENLQNLKATINWISEAKCKVVIEAMLFAEQSPTFAFACSNEDFHLILTGIFTTGRDVITFQDGTTLNAKTLTPMHQNVKPGFPCEFIVESSKKIENPIILILKDKTKIMYNTIPTVELFEDKTL